MINKFKEQNPDFDIINFNFFDKEAVRRLKYPQDLSAEETELFNEKLKAWQRLGRLVDGDEDLVERLYEKGFRSSYQIASMHKDQFIKLTTEVFAGFRNVKPEQVHKNALARKIKATLTYTAIAQQTAPYYRVCRFNNYQALTDSNFNGLPSYEDLFGNQNFCNCQDCRSVLSPAAYFVDLMRLQATYLKIDKETAYSLQSRRGDLWTLELSCGHTNTVVPKLEIVNKVLLSNSGLLESDMQGKNEDQDYEPLNKIFYPFNLPFNLPLAKIRQYLTTVKTSLADIWQNINSDNISAFTSQTIQLDTLGLSPEKWNICSTEVKESDEVTLASFYGLNDIKTGPDLVDKLQHVPIFLAQTGLDRNQLDIILSGDSSSDKLKKKCFVNATTGDEQKAAMRISIVINQGTEEEIIENLTFARLDHLNRFIRLAQALNWSFIDADWAIRTASSSSENLVVTLNEKSLPILSFIKKMQGYKNELSISQICAFVGVIKDFGLKGQTFFDIIYNSSNVANPPQWKDSDGEYKLHWLVPSVNQPNNDEQQQIQSALAAALKINLNDLITIADCMLKEQAISSRELPLTLPNLSILYRISRFTNIIALSVNEILAILTLPGSLKNGLKSLFGDDKTEENTCPVYDVYEWVMRYIGNIKNSKFSTYGLQYALTGYSDDIALRNQIVGSNVIQNFLTSFHQDISKVLANKDSFQNVLRSIFQQSQYSDKAVDIVYAMLVADQCIDKEGNVLKLPDIDQMKSIVISVFPKEESGSEADNLNVAELSDKLISLLKEYLASIKPLPKLTGAEFLKRSKDHFLSYMRWSEMLDKVWDDLVEAGIVNKNEIVINVVENYELILSNVLFPHIPNSLKGDIINLIASYFKSRYESQQFTLNKQLAALFNIAADMVPSLIVWQGLSVGDLDVVQAIEKIDGNNYYTSVPLLNDLLSAIGKDATNDSITIVRARLKLLQQYAYLSKQLLLSPVEIDNIRYNPHCYAVTYSKGQKDKILNQFTLKNIFIISSFKKLIQQYNDAQNHWISYINWVQNQSDSESDIKNIAEKLSEITGWDSNQVAFLIIKLWGKKKTEQNQSSVPMWGTIDGICQLQQWVEISMQLNLDVAILWQVYQLARLPSINSYSLYSSASTAIWSGLTKRYQDNLTQLTQVKGLVEEQKRSALLNLVLKQLQKKPIPAPVETARDLYEYLLIDVEVSGIVETSYINEAISAVQLYLHRCRNHLEKGVRAKVELDVWWDWIESYRVWMANRQVFLYPENYIEPELRKKKTPLFSQLENELKQLNLQERSNVEAAFSRYIDNFEKIADLQFVGAASRTDEFNLELKHFSKEYFFIGCTKQAPYTYYYRTAVFGRDNQSNYSVPLEWSPWSKIDLEIQPLGPVQPTFAFGKWFIFWVEQYQSGATKSTTLESGDNVDQQYSSIIKFSYLNLNGGWVPEQTFDEPVQLLQSIKTLNFKEYWDRVYPVYFSASQTLMIPYQKSNQIEEEKYTALISWNQGGLNKDVVACIKYAAQDSRYRSTPLASRIDTSTNNKIFYQYWYTFKSEAIPIAGDAFKLKNGFTLSTWLKENSTTSNDLTPIAHLRPIGDDTNYTAIYLDQERKITLQIGNSAYKTQKIEHITDWRLLTAKYIPADNIVIPGHSNISIYSTELFFHKFQYYTVVVLFNKDTENGAICIQKYTPEQITPYHEVRVIKGKASQPFVAIGGSLITLGDNEKFYFSWQEGPNKILISQIILDETGPRLTEPVKLDLTISNTARKSMPDFAVIEEKIYALWSNESEIITLGQLVNLESKEKVEVNIIKMDADFSGYFPAITASKGELYLTWLNNNLTEVYYCYGTPKDGVISLDPKIIIEGIKYYHSKMISLQSIGNQQFIAWLNEDASGLTELHCRIINNNEINFSVKVPDYKDGTWTNICQISDEVYLLSGSIDRLFFRLSQFQTFLDGKHFETLTLDSNISFNLEELFIGYSPAQGVIAWNSLMQETLLYSRILNNTEIDILYQNSEQQIIQDLSILLGISEKDGNPDFIKMLESSFWSFKNAPPNILYVLDEPSAVAINSNGIEYLNIFYNGKNEKENDAHFLSNCYRLNTTAASKLSEALFITGVDGLFTIGMQKSPEIPFSYLNPNSDYVPVKNWPLENIDFSLSSSMSQYYWEIFFHAPFLIANALKNQQQFAVSKSWYEYIFNPVINEKYFDLDKNDKDINDKYWRFLGLRSFNNQTLKTELDKPSWAEEMKMDLTDQVQLNQYHSDPFDPHAIATLRPIAYQKAVVMHYLNNILSWADNLFRQYTVETILEATMLYVMAYDLLGKQPLNLGDCPLPKDQTLDQILKNIGHPDKLQDIPEFLIILEQMQKHVAAITTKDNPNNYIDNSYFGLPDNEQFIGYWDKIKQALHNIRYGLNIDGIRQQLPLFQPPLNPMDLVQQINSGAILSLALADLKTQIPYYRFEVIIQKAKALTQTVVQFGQSLLSALEKRDNEQLLLLNHVNQQNILSLTQDLKEAELYVAENTVLSLESSLQNANDRLTHYTTLIEEGLSSNEITQIGLDLLSIEFQTVAQPIKAVAAALYPVPDIYGVAIGGGDIGSAVVQGASVLEGTASAMSTSAGLAATRASYDRRSEDWQLQQLIAQDDTKQIQYQILAAKYQQEIAKKDFMILKTNIKQEQDIQRFLTSKFTNDQLYQWMIGKLSSLYFYAYQLAYNLALQAEQAWKFEKGVDTNFIKQNYWDNLNYGLITGEVLQLDLANMENAYMEQNQRRFEIQKTISLKQLVDPKVFNNLIENGSCIFDITEKDFDLDYPGHYCRQIKTVSLSFPVLIGPYQNIHATLTQIANRTLIKANNNAIDYLYGDDTNAPDSSILRVNLMANQQIALSQGLNDTGLFMLNFNDERYLPFEGTGAISTWKLEMPLINNKLNIKNLSDLIIQLNYTAIAGSAAFSSYVKAKALFKGDK